VIGPMRNLDIQISQRPFQASREISNEQITSLATRR